MPEPEVIDGRMTETLRDNEAGIATAARLLRAGVLVAFGTETVYGLGADATQADAVAATSRARSSSTTSANAAKGRPPGGGPFGESIGAGQPDDGGACVGRTGRAYRGGAG